MGKKRSRTSSPVRLQRPDPKAAARNFEGDVERREKMKKSLKDSKKVSPDFFKKKMTI